MMKTLNLAWKSVSQPMIACLATLLSQWSVSQPQAPAG